MNLADLDYKEFEFLIGLLLTREGFRILRTPTEHRPFGPDFETTAPDSTPTFVEVKHFRRSPGMPVSLLDQFLGDIERLRAQHPGARGILAISGTLSGLARQRAVEHADLLVWDAPFLDALMAKHADVLPIVQRVTAARLNLIEQMESLKTGASARTTLLIEELRAIAPGRDAWKAYEDAGVRILAHIFSPALGAPEIQNRTEDGLDIMDAIFPIRSSEPPWSLVRSEYQSRFVVAEFKNYTGKIGQRQVESIAQYLWRKAHRTFGVLVSCKGPDESALLARRRAWVEQDKLIVFIDDDDLIGMLQMGETDDDPFQIIDAQLEEFFRRLSP